MTKHLVIAGDVAIDHFYLSTPPVGKDENWQLYPSFKTFLLPGGALMLADFAKHAVKAIGVKASITSPQPPQNLTGDDTFGMVQAKMFLGRFGDRKIIRVKEYLGYSGPAKPNDYRPVTITEPNFTDLLLFDDAGNGFRDLDPFSPRSINIDKTMVVYKMSRPLVKGRLWEKVKDRAGPLVLVINVKDLRRENNVNISKGLSWERTALETIFAIERSDTLFELRKASFIIILFGTDGALLYPKDKAMQPSLIFDPEKTEGGFAAMIEGHASGLTSAFVAALSAHILKSGGIAGVAGGTIAGLGAMRNLLLNGFIVNDENISYPSQEIFAEAKHTYAECDFERTADLNNADPDFFRILDRKTFLNKPLVTTDIVRHKNPRILKETPVGKFEALETFDRREIEQFNAIKALIEEFLDDPKPERPLCFAVFGPPGSGKSFGVKQVIKSLKRKDIETFTFNVSQYRSYEELIADFHRIRDRVLKNIVPVAFFDEFDSDLNNKPLGWLKYFLSPMQDAEFKEREAVHPLGKCILVFAGGTKHSFKKFDQSKCEDEAAKSAFSDAKGPDFVSRLRGIINIMGPNPNDLNGEIDAAYMIRRAKILRSAFEYTDKTKPLFNTEQMLRIDDSVLRAMINIHEYKHGNRSMTALIDMSRIAGKREFDQSSLPTAEQLDMHVDARLFMWLAARERFYTLLPAEERYHMLPEGCIEWENKIVEIIAKELHNDYIRHRSLTNEKTSSTVPWDKLSDNKKKSNLNAAEDIPAKLIKVGFAIRHIQEGKVPKVPVILDHEVDELAKTEHNRWCIEQSIQGWAYGEERNDETKKHPHLTDWSALSVKERRMDYQGIYALPLVLKNAGFEIFRMEDYFQQINEGLIIALAKALHEDYVIKRKLEGDTIESNPSMADFNDLATDFSEANMDSARTIPQKLALLHIELHEKFDDFIPEPIILTENEVEQLSQWEHSRWKLQKIMQGWSYSPGKKDLKKKTNPYIIPWAEVTEKIKEYDRESIRLIPKLIEQAGYFGVRKDK